MPCGLALTTKILLVYGVRYHKVLADVWRIEVTHYIARLSILQLIPHSLLTLIEQNIDPILGC